ncbi:hypothetical protein FACS1894110_11500 [Spirochaetia bacterium]|nr:hypothetical protein FACS1894110_11500 [Spirochaetia bacterium]
MRYGFKPIDNRQVYKANYIFQPQAIKHPTRNLEFHDIFYVIDGYYFLRLGEEEYRFNAGDIAVLPAFYPHFGTNLCKVKSRLIYIHFFKENEDRIITENDPHPENLLLTNTCINVNNPIIYQYFQEITKTYWSDRSYKNMHCSALLNLILIEMANECARNINKKDQIILNIQNVLAEYPHQFFTLGELARQSNLGIKTFSSRFKKVTGQSVHQYQLNSKLNQIAVLLRNETYTSLKYLAVNYGFYDEFHLSAAFKKKFGVSPKHYS